MDNSLSEERLLEYAYIARLKNYIFKLKKACDENIEETLLKFVSQLQTTTANPSKLSPFLLKKVYSFLSLNIADVSSRDQNFYKKYVDIYLNKKAFSMLRADTKIQKAIIQMIVLEFAKFVDEHYGKVSNYKEFIANNNTIEKFERRVLDTFKNRRPRQSLKNYITEYGADITLDASTILPIILAYTLQILKYAKYLSKLNKQIAPIIQEHKNNMLFLYMISHYQPDTAEQQIDYKDDIRFIRRRGKVTQARFGNRKQSLYFKQLGNSRQSSEFSITLDLAKRPLNRNVGLWMIKSIHKFYMTKIPEEVRNDQSVKLIILKPKNINPKYASKIDNIFSENVLNKSLKINKWVLNNVGVEYSL